MMENLSIRRATLGDLKTVQELNHDLFASDASRDKYLNHNWPYEEGEEYFKKIIVSENCICVVAESDGEIIGYLAGCILKTESWRIVKRTELENMFVKRDFRSQGVGAKLVDEFLKWSKEKGVERALVVAYATNYGAIKFYQGSGFLPEAISLEIDIK